MPHCGCRVTTEARPSQMGCSCRLPSSRWLCALSPPHSPLTGFSDGVLPGHAQHSSAHTQVAGTCQSRRVLCNRPRVLAKRSPGTTGRRASSLFLKTGDEVFKGEVRRCSALSLRLQKRDGGFPGPPAPSSLSPAGGSKLNPGKQPFEEAEREAKALGRNQTLEDRLKGSLVLKTRKTPGVLSQDRGPGGWPWPGGHLLPELSSPLRWRTGGWCPGPMPAL